MVYETNSCFLSLLNIVSGCNKGTNIMRIVRIAIVGILVGMLAACSTGPRVYTDVDPVADFGQYQSFAFFESAGKSTEKYGTLMGQRLEDAISSALEARGYQVDTRHPDILVNYHIEEIEKQRVQPTTFHGGYYGYRNGMYVGWPGYVEPGYVDTYTEGTITIDLVDRRADQMIWEGTAVGRVTNDMRNAPDQSVRNAIAAIFGKYPYVAGSNVLVVPVAQ